MAKNKNQTDADYIRAEAPDLDPEPWSPEHRRLWVVRHELSSLHHSYEKNRNDFAMQGMVQAVMCILDELIEYEEEIDKTINNG